MRNSESARRELERARSSFPSSLRLDPRLLEVGGADEAAREAEREAAQGACPSRLLFVVTACLRSYAANVRERWRAGLFGSPAQTGPVVETVLWRGMKNLNVTQRFLVLGGTELAPMSTTTNLEIATRYARGADTALLFRLRSTTFMNLGCDLTELSAFPHEKEYLYPSLTFLQPTGVTHTLVHNGATYTVVEAELSFPS